MNLRPRIEGELRNPSTGANAVEPDRQNVLQGRRDLQLATPLVGLKVASVVDDEVRVHDGFGQLFAKQRYAPRCSRESE